MKVLSGISKNSGYIRVDNLVKIDVRKVLLRIKKIDTLNAKHGDNLAFIHQYTESYTSAQDFLKVTSFKGIDLPCAIIIELPYIKKELKSFSKWIDKSIEFRDIPILYNKAYLTSTKANEKKALEFVDDIISFDDKENLLISKCEFLHKVRESQHINHSRIISNSISNVYGKTSGLSFCIKRMIDILMSFSLLLLLSPLLLIIGLAIKIESSGPAIYTSRRAGKGYKVFKFYKFRTMQADAENKREQLNNLNLYNNQNSKAKFFKIKDDPRITKLGAFLRNTSLDELPQLFNVLKGDMSIVGNRPLPLYEAATLTTNEWAQRFMAPAGITGLWQIMKRGREEMSVTERINLDISYANCNGLLRDFWILVKTPTAMLQKSNV